MSLHNAERQVAPVVNLIRRDHVARYEWAAGRVSGRVLDLACGIGYGSKLLAVPCFEVVAIDRDAETLDYARRHYAAPGIIYRQADAMEPMRDMEPVDAVVCFETIEHLPDPRPMLRRFTDLSPKLLCSVPNEDVFPFASGVLHHYRHYTRAQFGALLAECGWTVSEWWGQQGPESDVEPGGEGRTLIAVCRRTFDKGEPAQPLPDLAAEFDRPDPARDWPRPKHVALLGLGPSLEEYLKLAKGLGGRNAYCDEVWGINAVGGVLQCDRIFHMDDVRIQQTRADARPESNIARMLEWMKAHPGPIYTSRPHADYPGLVPYPLEAVVDELRHPYFNSTAAYAIAFAIRLGVEKLSIYGCDFTYPDAHDAERGRGCFEFWLGMAAARGIKLAMPKISSLMDACYPRGERLYGYDTVDVHLQQDDGIVTCQFTERVGPLPTADEIEARYDHSAHPNPLVTGDR